MADHVEIEQFWVDARAVDLIRSGAAATLPEGLGGISGFEIDHHTNISSRISQVRAYGVVDGATHEAVGTFTTPRPMLSMMQKLIGREVRGFAYVERVSTPSV